MSIKTWQVTAQVVFPTHLPPDVDAEGNLQLPKQLRATSRVPVARREIDGAIVLIREGDTAAMPQIQGDIRFEVAEIVVRLDAEVEGPFDAAQAAVPVLDRVLESLSFQMQTALQIQSVRVLDITGSPTIGEDREFAQWSGFATPTFRPTSVPMQSLVGRIVPDPQIDLDPDDARANRALDWYLKALTAPFEADHFIFLWISCEILAADSEISVIDPFRAPCGHLIEQCPVCETSTARRVQGRSMIRWFTEGFGVEEGIAKRVWKARQMLHGAVAFESTVMEELPELTQWLRAVVVAELKRRLGIPMDEPPFAAGTGLSISPFMGVSGTAKITARDIEPSG